MQSINYSGFTPLLTGAIQELYKIIEKQSNDIKELKYTLEHLMKNNMY
jgi:hypothetical protein